MAVNSGTGMCCSAVKAMPLLTSNSKPRATWKRGVRGAQPGRPVAQAHPDQHQPGLHAVARPQQHRQREMLAEVAGDGVQGGEVQRRQQHQPHPQQRAPGGGACAHARWTRCCKACHTGVSVPGRSGRLPRSCVALAGGVEVAAARGTEVEFARHGAVLAHVGLAMAAGQHLHAAATMGDETR